MSGKNDFVLLVATHPAALDHQPGAWHPERPERLHAVLDALRAPEIAKHTAEVEPREAASSELAAVHDAELIELFAKLDAAGGGAIDADTTMSKHSLRASRLAAGAGLACVDALRAGEGDAAFVAMRPPGHHTSPSRAMGFCLLNNVAVTARALADAGERVLILDWDVHHGNGTQEAFWDDPRVLFVSLHQYGIYPGTGAADEVGESGNVINVPLPAGTTGDAYQLADRRDRRAFRGSFRAKLGTRIGRVRCAPRRPARRALPQLRRLRRAGRVGASASASENDLVSRRRLRPRRTSLVGGRRRRPPRWYAGLVHCSYARRSGNRCGSLCCHLAVRGRPHLSVDAVLAAPAGVALLARLEAEQRNDVPFGSPVDSDPGAVARAVEAATPPRRLPTLIAMRSFEDRLP